MKEIATYNIEENIDYLKLLSKQYPSIRDVSAEIINLQAILNLPKGTEHFLTDLHGEYEAFTHVLRNASGVLKLKIDDIFQKLTIEQKRSLAILLYYPEQKLEIEKKTNTDIKNWYSETLYRLIQICRVVSSKYSRSKVRKALPKQFAYIIEELLHEDRDMLNKHNYFNEIINTIIDIDSADEFIIAICKLIQRLAIDRLHILGDIYDRGPGAHFILDELCSHHSVDIQWGNHDILWMGAASGSKACIANVIRISTRYANLATIEEGYGINLLPLATFAMHFYKNDPCNKFKTKFPIQMHYGERDLKMIAAMHKAISIIQFKLEGQIIKRSPQYNMEHRLLLDKIDYKETTIVLEGKQYKLNDDNFPTIDPQDPYRLSREEEDLMDRLELYFRNSEKLQKHIRFLYSHGSMYLKMNSNLLYHGCIPLDDSGEFKKVKVGKLHYSGKELLDIWDKLIRKAYFDKANIDEEQYGADIMWYLWCGDSSPLFGKDKMTTFERYFIDDKKTHIEVKNPYFHLRDDEEVCKKILREFDLDTKDSHIINGHVPVKTKQGESPIKAGGKLLVIDGGFSRAYQPMTGIAGYTLIYNSYGLRLASHEPFESTDKAVNEEKDIVSTLKVLEKINRKYIANTDEGKEIMSKIERLKMLLVAYRNGILKER
ncbi:fructose-1,6-bisphosphatase [Clostridiaceae bacterium M8S5]|nr:fructose-1,6-bisphosphatase [Clostridiaceae bacterium M8S5]